MAISAVGSPTTTNGTAITTQSFTSSTAGDLLAFATLVTNSGRTVTAVAGHGAAWTLGVRLATAAVGVTVELWTGMVVTPGTSNITVTWSASVAAMFVAFDTQAFTAGLGANTVWAVDKSGSQDNATATTCAFPSLTPFGSGELYVGFGYGDAGPLLTAGGTAGYAMTRDISDNMYISSTVADTATQSPASGPTTTQTSHSIALLISAGLPVTIPQPYTARRRAANF